MRVVILCSDHPRFAAVLREVLEGEPDVGEVAVAVSATRPARMDVLVVSARSAAGTPVIPDPRSAGLAMVIAPAADRDERLALFAAGFDEVLHGDVSTAEVVARVRAFGCRRGAAGSAGAGAVSVRVGRSGIGPGPSGGRVKLTEVERRLLSALRAEPGRTVPTAEILEAVWGSTAVAPSTLSAYIRRLRRKIEPEPHNPVFIQTVRGVGYRFEVTEVLPLDPMALRSRPGAVAGQQDGSGQDEAQYREDARFVLGQ